MGRINLRDYQITDAKIDDNVLVEAAQHVLENYQFGEGLVLVNRMGWRIIHWLESGEKVAQTVAAVQIKNNNSKLMAVLQKGLAYHLSVGDPMEIKGRGHYPIAVSVPFNDLGSITRNHIKSYIRYDTDDTRISVNIGRVDDSVIEEAETMVQSAIFMKMAEVLNKTMRK